MKKYEFTDETKIINGTVLRRIRAVRDIPEHGVRVGLIGGFLQSERNLSHDCPAWGAIYFIPDLGRESLVSRQVWTGGEADRRVLERGLVHLLSADAYQHADALLRGTALPRRFVAEPSKPEY